MKMERRNTVVIAPVDGESASVIVTMSVAVNISRVASGEELVLHVPAMPAKQKEPAAVRVVAVVSCCQSQKGRRLR